MFSTFAIPKGTPGLYFSSGNQATCTAQGFFVQLGMIQPAYVASLSINYLMVIKYSKSDEYLSKYLEPWMHLVSLGYPLFGAIVMASLGYFNPNPNGCFIGPSPMDCYVKGKGPCVRGQHYYLMSWIFGITMSVSGVVMVICMWNVVLFVRKRLVTMRDRFSFAHRSISSCKNLEKQYIAAKTQALLYVMAHILVWVFPILYRVSSKTRIPHLLIPVQLLNPLQGFFNFFIYTWPRYEKAKEENPHKSYWWLIKDSIITTVKEKEARRRLSDVQQRTMKKRMSLLRRREQGSRHELRSSNKILNGDLVILSISSIVDESVSVEEPIATLQQIQRLDRVRDVDLIDGVIESGH
jgi:hypothetical protein